jgi:hypothetical protein
MFGMIAVFFGGFFLFMISIYVYLTIFVNVGNYEFMQPYLYGFIVSTFPYLIIKIYKSGERKQRKIDIAERGNR